MSNLTRIIKISNGEGFFSTPFNIKFLVIFNTLEVSPIFIIQTSCNCAVAAQFQLVFYPDNFLSRFNISHIGIEYLHLLHQTNYRNEKNTCFRCNYVPETSITRWDGNWVHGLNWWGPHT